MACNCTKKKLSPVGKRIVKKSAPANKRPVKTGSRRIIRRTVR